MCSLLCITALVHTWHTYIHAKDAQTVGECRASELHRKEVKCRYFFCFPSMPLFLLFLFFYQLGQSCCGPWCKVPRARRWNSNMDHLTPVKTALLAERQALSACRGKCYAASQFPPSFPLSLSLSRSLSVSFPTLAHTRSAFPPILTPEYPANSLSPFSHPSLFPIFSHLSYSLTLYFAHLSLSFFFYLYLDCKSFAVTRLYVCVLMSFSCVTRVDKQSNQIWLKY